MLSSLALDTHMHTLQARHLLFHLARGRAMQPCRMQLMWSYEELPYSFRTRSFRPRLVLHGVVPSVHISVCVSSR